MAALQAPTQSWPLWASAGLGFLLIVVLCVIAFSFAVRRLFTGRPDSATESGGSSLRQENPSAFVTASMQGVIAKLREQEKELERLHQMEKERAEETERLSEAVTRNMPAGLLLVNATGTISSANPAAEAALGVGALQYRRYTDVLGPDSPLAAMLAVASPMASTSSATKLSTSIPPAKSRPHRRRHHLADFAPGPRRLPSRPASRFARGKNHRRSLPHERPHRARRPPAAGPLEGESRRPWRDVCRASLTNSRIPWPPSPATPR